MSGGGNKISVIVWKILKLELDKLTLEDWLRRPELDSIWLSLQSEGREVEPITRRELLAWFGKKRNGRNVKGAIVSSLNGYKITTEPNILDTTIGIDQPCQVVKQQQPIRETLKDSIRTIDDMPSADLREVGILHKVKLDDSIQKAMTMMLRYSISQLPVMDKKDNLVSFISWKTFGINASHGKVINASSKVRDFCESDFARVFIDDELYTSIPIIIDKEFVFVFERTNLKVPIGIVTTEDLASLFWEWTAPFLYLGEIEDHLRHICNGYVFPEDLKKELDELKPRVNKLQKSLRQFTYFDYETIISSDTAWPKLALSADQSELKSAMTKARDVRNSIMHFRNDSEDMSYAPIYELLNLLKGIRKGVDR